MAYNTGHHYHSYRCLLSVDPVANKYPGISPYVHTLDNPIKYRDADGREVDVAIDDNTITFSSTIYIYGTNSQVLAASYQRAFDKFAQAQLTNRTYVDGTKIYNVVFKMIFVPASNADAERIRNNKNEEAAESLVFIDGRVVRGAAGESVPHPNYNRSFYDGAAGDPATDRASGNGVGWSGTEPLSILHELFHNWGLGDRYVEHPPQFYYVVGDKKYPASVGPVPAEGFDRMDIMVNCGLNTGNTFSQIHINNLASKALGESKRRGVTHFVMGREVDNATKDTNKPVYELNINGAVYKADEAKNK